VESLDAGEVDVEVAVVNRAAEEIPVAGKRKREEEGREEGNAPPSTREASEAAPLQPTDLMSEASWMTSSPVLIQMSALTDAACMLAVGRGVLSVDGDASKARSAAAAFRIATRYTMMTGEVSGHRCA
jgi:hypothetical protein